MFRSLLFGIGLSALFTNASVHAQDIMLQIYGEAVHDYFAGNYQRAQMRLTQVVDAGSRDPRVYYFRGLASRGMGFEDSANEDFRVAAELEARFGGTEFVGQALTRVQGSDRLKLEKYRTEAQMAVFQQRQRMRRERFGTPATPGPGDIGVEPGPAEPPLPDAGAEKDEAPDLFAAPDDAAPAETPDDGADGLFDAPADEGPPAEAPDDLFGGAADDAPPAERPGKAGDGLFDAPAGEGEAAEPEMSDEPMVDPADDDLFGLDDTRPAAGGDNGGEAGEAPAADRPVEGDDTDPFGDDPEQPEDNPFA